MNDGYDSYTIEHFREGMRIELHPVTDFWLAGARYGTVVRVGREKALHARPDARRPGDLSRAAAAGGGLGEPGLERDSARGHVACGRCRVTGITRWRCYRVVKTST